MDADDCSFWHRRSFATTIATTPGDDDPSDDNNGNNNDDNNDDDDDFRPPRWLQKMQRRVASNKPIDSQKAYKYLKLEKFSEDELRDRFRAIRKSGTRNPSSLEKEHNTPNNNNNHQQSSCINQKMLLAYMSETIRTEEQDCNEALRRLQWSSKNNNTSDSVVSSEPSSDSTPSSSSAAAPAAHIDRLRTEFTEAETQQLWNYLTPNNNNAIAIANENEDESKPSSSQSLLSLTESQFVERLTTEATSLDKQRLWPLTLSMVMIGLSVGVTTPAFPFVVQNLGLTTGEYGMVVSAFALTKLMGNIPFAVLVERNGRKVRVCVW